MDERRYGPAYPLRYTQSGFIFMGPEDDCDAVVDAMLAVGYAGEFCVGQDWEPLFIARLMKAGFLVMSTSMVDADETGKLFLRDIVLPKLHLVRSALFFPSLHVKRSIKSRLSRYELCFDTDFETVVNKCLETHGEDWLTPSLVKTIFLLREQFGVENPINEASAGNIETPQDTAKPLVQMPSTHTPLALVPSAVPRPVSFSLYSDGELKAGEFGVLCGGVYTSYSGYREEDNAGTVQMILMARALEDAGFAFLDFGMPLNYKADLGAQNISPEEFLRLFRAAR
jgi:Leu/Phe-tRNA-protein transferase